MNLSESSSLGFRDKACLQSRFIPAYVYSKENTKQFSSLTEHIHSCPSCMNYFVQYKRSHLELASYIPQAPLPKKNSEHLIFEIQDLTKNMFKLHRRFSPNPNPVLRFARDYFFAAKETFFSKDLIWILTSSMAVFMLYRLI